MADDLFTALRNLANRWVMMTRDYSRDAKSETDIEKAAYRRGYAEAYYRAATDLATLLKEQEDKAQSAAPPPPDIAAPPAAYDAVSMNEALTVLSYAGVDPRDVEQRKDNSFRAVFSKWQNFMDHERVEKIKKADMRIVVLTSGRTKESNDPFIEFAFKTN